MQVKIFETTSTKDLEQKINSFLSENNALGGRKELKDIKYVVSTPGNEDGSSELYSAIVIYE